jgi:hypothetical protein
MELNFTRLDKPDEYSIARNGELIFIAACNKTENITELYNIDRVKVAQGFCSYSNSLQLTPDYSILLFTKDNCEVVIRPNSVIGQTYFFEFGEREHFVISHPGDKYSIFRDYKQIALYQTRSVNMAPQNMLMVVDNDLCMELFCLLALYLHSDFGSEDPSINPAFYITMQKTRFNKNWIPT